MLRIYGTGDSSPAELLARRQLLSERRANALQIVWLLGSAFSPGVPLSRLLDLTDLHRMRPSGGRPEQAARLCLAGRQIVLAQSWYDTNAQVSVRGPLLRLSGPPVCRMG